MSKRKERSFCPAEQGTLYIMKILAAVISIITLMTFTIASGADSGTLTGKAAPAGSAKAAQEQSARNSVVIPEAVKTIEAEAFENNTQIQSVTLPAGLTAIESRAFAGCTNLKSVVFPSSTVAIAEDAFEGCEKVSFICPEDIAASYAIPHRIPYEIYLSPENCPHSWKIVDTVSPTCTDRGYTLHTCSSCGDSYKDNYTNALGHSYSISSSTPATCSQPEVIIYTCSRCSASTQEYGANPTGHSYTDSVVAPTCTNQGYTTHTCSKCGNTYNDSFVNAIGHNWEHHHKEDITSTIVGIRCCCGLKFDSVDSWRMHFLSLPAEVMYDHSWSSYSDTTVIEAGYDYYICLTCGERK